MPSGPGRLHNAAALPALVGTQLVAQTFIRRRSRSRWLAHQLVFWGCILAALITFPLTLGPAALRERRPAGRPLPGVRVEGRHRRASTPGSIVGWVIFHGLDIAAVLVLAGVFIFLRRRLEDPGALAVERSGDFLALAGLFAVSVTGLFLTVSSTWLDGQFYSALNTIHALTVILGLMYLPFGKLFHIFQRPGNLGVAYYRAANVEGPAAVCRRCGEASPAPSRSPTSRRSCLRSGSTTASTGAATTRTPARGCRRRLRHPGAGRTSRRVRLMARLPITEAALVERYGPHLNEAPPGGWDAGLEIDQVVETHCCFCGQQCGIKLKVHDNQVVGFEPWYDFPFNEGKLCPKGVKRYLQGGHPDRLLHPMVRDESAPGGFRNVGWDEALSRVVGEIQRIQADLRRRRLRHALRGLAHQREELPHRQVRPAGAAHREPRLQRPLLHGVGGRRQQEGARGRPGAEPVERHPARRRRLGRRLEHRRDVPDHHQLHLAGPRPRGRSSSSRTPGSSRWPGPPTCSCRSGPAATRPSSAPSSTS